MRRPLLWICTCLLGLLILWSVMIDAPPWQSDSLKAMEGRKIVLTGQVYQKENRTLYGEPVLVLYLRSVTISENNSINLSDTYSKDKTANAGNKSIKERILVRIPLSAFGKQEQLPLGCTVCLSGQLSLFSYARNPGEFDEGLYYGIQKVGATLKNPVILGQDDDRWYLRESVYGLKQALLGRLYRSFPEREGHVLAKMMLGEKDGLDPELKRLYQENGIAHILAISGLHISMLGMGIYHLLRKLTCPQKAAALTGGVVILVYGCMTGFGISAIRAVGMYLIHMLGEIRGKTYDMLTAMGVLALSMAVSNPRLVYHSGFLLSFGSVCAMGMVLPVLKETGSENSGRSGIRNRLWRRLLKRTAGTGHKNLLRDKFRDLLLASFSVTITTLPIQLWFFYQVPLYSVFLNLLILPLMSMVIGGGILGILLGRMTFLSIPVVWILRWYEAVCQKGETLPAHLLRIGRPAPWQVLLYYGLLFAALGVLYRTIRKREVGEIRHSRRLDDLADRAGPWLIAAALAVLLAVPVGSRSAVTFLDVGQGDGVVLQYEGKVYLFDLGSSTKHNVGEKILIPYMHYYGLDRIEAIFLSHEDVDHCNGIANLLQSDDIEVGSVYLPYSYRETLEKTGEKTSSDRKAENSPFAQIYRLALERGCKVRFIKAGDRLTVEGKKPILFSDKRPGEDGLQILCLHPPGEYRASSNEQSACYYVTLEGIRVLLTGDVEKEGEELLIRALQKRGIQGIHLLKTAHHGSSTSTSEQLLERIRPDLAVISCGIQNQYGHPHRETLERLEAAGTVVLRTDLGGAITVEWGKEGMRIREYCGGDR